MPVTLRTATIVLLTFLSSAGCARDERAGADQPENYRELQMQLRPTYRVRRPADLHSTTVVLVVPGCSGFGPKHYDAEATRLTAAGFIVVNVDYLAATRLPTACPAPGDTGLPMPAAIIAEYVLAAAADVRSDPSIRATRVFALGGSLGGGAVLAALSSKSPDPFPVDGVAALYPQCRGVSRWKRSLPVLMLLGGLDNIASPEVCQDLLAGKDSTGPTLVHTYQGAHHAFDADAWRRIVDFLRR